MIIKGDLSNWKDTLAQFVLLNNLDPKEAPIYQEFIENLVGALTEAWGAIIKEKVTESQNVVIPLILLIKIGALVSAFDRILGGDFESVKATQDVKILLDDPQIQEFIKNPSNQVYLPPKK